MEGELVAVVLPRRAVEVEEVMEGREVGPRTGAPGVEAPEVETDNPEEGDPATEEEAGCDRPARP